MDHYKDAIKNFTLKQATNEKNLIVYNFDQIKEKTVRQLKTLDDKIKELRDNGEILFEESGRTSKEVKRKDPPTEADGSMD